MSREGPARTSRPRVAVVVFPGSNCEHDAAAALELAGASPELVWHMAGALDGFDAAVVPGGFAHGDYLRPGAIARFSPVMGAVASLAARGLPLLGICNGFQVLTEAGLLPGALRRNAGLRFLCETVACTVRSHASALTASVPVGTRLQLPINHFEGNYTCDDATLGSLESSRRVVLTYDEPPNGSVAGIAGICNAEGNVVGLMPHPERACDELLGGSDGRLLLESFVASAARRSAGSGQAGSRLSSAGSGQAGSRLSSAAATA